MRKLVSVAVGLLFCAIQLSQQNAQSVKNEEGSANRKDSTAKTVQGLTQQIDDLKSRIRKLETEQDELRVHLAQVERPQISADLNEAGSELARFNCEPDFNRAHAMAIAQGSPGYTLEGAAAMNCTQRLAKITEKAVRIIQSH